MGFKKVSEKTWKYFLGLNEKQREQISKLFDKLAVSSLLPIALKLMSDGKSGDYLSISFWLMCARCLVPLLAGTDSF